MLERWVWWWWSAVLSAVPHCIDGLLWVSESSRLPFSTSATVLQLFIFHDAVRGNTLLMADFPCKEKWWSLYLAAHFTLQNLSSWFFLPNPQHWWLLLHHNRRRWVRWTFSHQGMSRIRGLGLPVSGKKTSIAWVLLGFLMPFSWSAVNRHYYGCALHFC